MKHHRNIVVEWEFRKKKARQSFSLLGIGHRAVMANLFEAARPKCSKSRIFSIRVPTQDSRVFPQKKPSAIIVREK